MGPVFAWPGKPGGKTGLLAGKSGAGLKISFISDGITIVRRRLIAQTRKKRMYFFSIKSLGTSIK